MRSWIKVKCNYYGHAITNESKNMKRETGNKPAATGEEIAKIDGKKTSFITGVHSTFRQQPTSCSFGQYACKIKLKTRF
jgi:hypothetical protein